MKALCTVFVILIISTCGCSNIHHVSNDFRWKNLCHPEVLKYKLIFEPIVEENFHPNAYQLLEYFFDTYRQDQFKKMFVEKLSNRGFQLNNENYDIIIRLDQMNITELVEVQDVSVNGGLEEVRMGTYFSYAMEINFKGRILQNGTIKDFKEEKKILSIPTKSSARNLSVRHTNWDLDFDKIFENMFNRMSVDIFYLTAILPEYQSDGY